MSLNQILQGNWIEKIMDEVLFDTKLKAPFPYFGGKGLIADIVWNYLGDVKRYIEPFAGSCAVLLKRPPTKQEKIYEIICEKDGFVSNVWRAIKLKPDETAHYCDWPVNHADLVARKKYLLKHKKELLKNLCDDPEYCDPKLAGYWIWCASSWIGTGMMCPNQRPHIVRDKGIHSKRPHLTKDMGIHSKIPHLIRDMGIHVKNDIYAWLNFLSQRLRNVKVVCGDWTRVCGGNWQANNKPVGIFFDPPYATSERDQNLYDEESLMVAKDVEKWALERGANKDYRIICCGYEGEYPELIKNGWHVHKWSAAGGYSRKNTKGAENRHLERLFISPHCLSEQKAEGLFE
jgi:DNA adenine methylase